MSVVEVFRFLLHTKNSTTWRAYREHTQALRDLAAEMRASNEQIREKL
jgi:hypothetical protein